MNRSLTICLIIGFIVGLGACQTNKDGTIVSPDGYVLRNITPPEDSLIQYWVYDANNGEYLMRYDAGAGADQIIITDRQGRLCAAKGVNPCVFQRVKITYDGERPKTYCLMWIDENNDEDEEYEEDLGVIFDALLKGELMKRERIDSIEICSLRYDPDGFVIEVYDSISGKSLKAPEGHCITTEIEETGAMAGALDYNFRLTNTIRPKGEKDEPYVEQKYSGYTLLKND